MTYEIYNLYGMYGEPWPRGDLAKGAMGHPAKFSRALIRQIYKICFEEGWVKKGDRVLDIFAGVGLGAMDAMINGLRWRGIELESKYQKLGEANITLWRRKYANLPLFNPDAIIYQGDSQNLLKTVSSGDINISSPPYAQTALHFDANSLGTDKVTGEHIKQPFPLIEGARNYSKDKNNLGNMPDDKFWSAAHTIIDQLFIALKPGAHAIFVCKSYVRGGKTIEFPTQWRMLCEAAGFATERIYYAWTAENRGTQIDLQGNHHTKIVDHKSMFRRLQEKKGSPKIEYEEVLVFIKQQ